MFVCLRRHEAGHFVATVCHNLISVFLIKFLTNLSRDFLTNIDWLLQLHGSIGCFNWFITPTIAHSSTVKKVTVMHSVVH